MLQQSDKPRRKITILIETITEERKEQNDKQKHQGNSSKT